MFSYKTSKNKRREKYATISILAEKYESLPRLCKASSVKNIQRPTEKCDSCACKHLVQTGRAPTTIDLD